MTIAPTLRHALAPLVLATALLAPRPAPAQNTVDAIEYVRKTIHLDRQAAVAEGLQLTEAESTRFWPLYRDYRAEVERVGDDLVKLVLEYADVYPSALDEKRAAKMVREVTRLERQWLNAKIRCSRKLEGTLPASKILRFLQLENRLDLQLRLQLASAIPLVPSAPSTGAPPR